MESKLHCSAAGSKPERQAREQRFVHDVNITNKSMHAEAVVNTRKALALMVPHTHFSIWLGGKR